jgi:hypothetical protein
MLKAGFQWLDTHPAVYWVLALAPTLVLLGSVLRVLREETAAGPAGSPLRATWRDGLLLFAFLLAWRWPFLFSATEYNPDESQLIAGALSLVRDPVFWRSVDGTTSGPLNFYVLLPLHWLGAPLDYFMARLLGLGFVWGALLACHRLLAGRFGRGTAWLAVLPAACFFATTFDNDFLQYSSELPALLLVAGAAALLGSPSPGRNTRLWLGCAVAGAAPWAKLQVAPLSVVLIAWGVWSAGREARGRGQPVLRAVGSVLLAAVAPTLLGFGLLWLTGQTETALRRYFLHNLYYLDSQLNLAPAVRQIVASALQHGHFPLLLLVAAAGIGAATVQALRSRQRLAPLYGLALGLTVAAVVSVLTPRREFLHYLLLLPVPLTLWLGAAVGSVRPGLASLGSRRWWSGLLFVLGGLLPLAFRCTQPAPFIFGQFADHWRHPRSAEAVLVRALTRPGDPVGVWGWANYIWAESGRPQGARDAHTSWSMLPNAQLDYHRAVYLADLQRNTPPVFVDAVGPDAFGFRHRPTQAHEIFPALADYIRTNYVLVTDLGNARVYARRDLPALRDLTPDRLNQILAQGHLADHWPVAPPFAVPPARIEYRFIGGQQVLMLLPPERAEWDLAPDVRAVSLVFGFDPVAIDRGNSNGAELTLEVARNGASSVVYHRYLDPAKNPGDRNPIAALVALPDLPPGSRLILRTGPGEFGDNAWDWVYLSRLRFKHGPGDTP